VSHAVAGSGCCATGQAGLAVEGVAGVHREIVDGNFERCHDRRGYRAAVDGLDFVISSFLPALR